MSSAADRAATGAPAPEGTPQAGDGSPEGTGQAGGGHTEDPAQFGVGQAGAGHAEGTGQAGGGQTEAPGGGPPLAPGPPGAGSALQDGQLGTVAPGAARQRRRAGNGFATAALALGVAGVSLVTVVPAVLFGVLGLRRAASRGSGRVRSWLGIALSAVWAAAGVYVVPHLIRAADPGCTAYKGNALTAYNKVIADFNGNRRSSMTADISRAAAALGAAAARAKHTTTARDLADLTAQLRAVLADIKDGTVVSGAALSTLNRDAARTDAACGTLRV